jgi:hypothetical protein
MWCNDCCQVTTQCASAGPEGEREALEAKAVGGASTVKEERKPRPVVSLTARSEPYNQTAIHASRLNQARMRNGMEIAESDVAARNHGSQRRHRWRHRIATGKANVFGLCSEAPPFVPQRKTRSLWLPARVVAVPAVSRCRARMQCGTQTVRCWRAMWSRVMCKRRHRPRFE